MDSATGAMLQDDQEFQQHRLTSCGGTETVQVNGCGSTVVSSCDGVIVTDET